VTFIVSVVAPGKKVDCSVALCVEFVLSVSVVALGEEVVGSVVFSVAVNRVLL
jgi:hypothetical protein